MDQVKMIRDMVCIIGNGNMRSSYTKLVGIIANQLKLPNSSIVTSTEAKLFTDNFSIDALRESVDDWLTMALEEDNVIPRLSYNCLDVIKADLASRYDGSFVVPLFIPYQGGRLMIAAYNIIGRNALYMCVEPDILLYRIALINSKLYNIPSMILNIDHTKYDVGLMSKYWDLSGRWEIGDLNDK